MGSSISYFSLLQLNSLPSIAPYCNRYISAQKWILITASQKEEKYLDRVRVREFAVQLKEREYLRGGGAELSLYSLFFMQENLQPIIMLC